MIRRAGLAYGNVIVCREGLAEPWRGETLAHEALHLESLIDDLLARGYNVVLTSDHGHVEARGQGTLSEGLAVETRSQRARVYRNPLAAQRAHEQCPNTILWEARGILPENLWVLIPQKRGAFAHSGTTVMTHGGLTLDEVVVPLVAISMRQAI